MTYWFRDRFGASPAEVFTQPFQYAPSRLPLFYASLIRTWRALQGSSSPAGLTVGTQPRLPAKTFSCKTCYELLLSLHPCVPHCVTKFRPIFGHLDWATTWRSLFLMPLDSQCINLSWKVAHGVLYTADRLISFGYDIPSAQNICSFPARWPRVG